MKGNWIKRAWKCEIKKKQQENGNEEKQRNVASISIYGQSPFVFASESKHNYLKRQPKPCRNLTAWMTWDCDAFLHGWWFKMVYTEITLQNGVGWCEKQLEMEGYGKLSHDPRQINSGSEWKYI